MKVTLKTLTPDAEVNIVEIARVSSTRQDKSEKPEGLINYLIKNSHWSPFQHSYLTFEIDTSKAICIQFLRHLSFTFQEFSQRYAEVTEIEEVEFRIQAQHNRQSSTEPVAQVFQFKGVDGLHQMDSMVFPGFEGTEIEFWIKEVQEHFRKSLALYKKGLELGIAKECARMRKNDFAHGHQDYALYDWIGEELDTLFNDP